VTTAYRTPSPLRHIGFGLASLGALLIVAGGAVGLLDQLSERSDQSVRLWSGIERVELDVGRGDVEIVPARGKRVRVREERRSGTVSASSSQSRAGSTLKLEGGCHVFVLTCEVDYRIEVPAGTALDVEAFAGGITVRDTEGNVRLESKAGAVRALGVRGRRIDIRTSAGIAEADRVTARYVSVRTAAGNAVASVLEPPRDLLVETHAGDAEAFVPDVGYRIDADSDAGDAKVRVRRNDLSGRSLRVRTNAGNATVRALRER
jgi:hypothetical protein